MILSVPSVKAVQFSGILTGFTNSNLTIRGIYWKLPKKKVLAKLECLVIFMLSCLFSLCNNCDIELKLASQVHCASFSTLTISIAITIWTLIVQGIYWISLFDFLNLLINKYVIQSLTGLIIIQFSSSCLLVFKKTIDCFVVGTAKK